VTPDPRTTSNPSRLVVISNRVPASSAKDRAGGLAVALYDALSDSGGTWLGWSGAHSREREGMPSVVQEGRISFATFPLTNYDLDQYYGGYANSVLWPMFHEMLHAMEYRESYRKAYYDVNAHFADHAAAVIGTSDVTWVHDYHLIPLGGELRKRGVTGRIGFFLHIPFPPFDVFRALPEHRALLQSFMAYDLVGFQSRSDARNFADTLRHVLGARVDDGEGRAELHHEQVRFDAFPIGIDVDATALTALHHRASRSGQRLTRALRGRQLVIGADRLDYTKGLVERFHAFEGFLARHGKELDDRMIYVQITAPSREEVREYQEIARQLEAEAGRINGHHGSMHWTPLRLIEQQVAHDTLLGYFSLADVGLVTPLRDGMNLVAKEFLAAQTAEDPGVLVLSSMAGAARELEDAAIVVNPYDSNEVAEGIYSALTMPQDERRRRWGQGMDSLRSNTVCMWRDRFLSALVGTDQGAAGSRTLRNLRTVP
jgi:trehalose 6-phosphate synthase